MLGNINFKHYLKAENIEDSLASLCEEFCIGFHVLNPVWDWVTIGTNQWQSLYDGLHYKDDQCSMSCIWVVLSRFAHIFYKLLSLENFMYALMHLFPSQRSQFCIQNTRHL